MALQKLRRPSLLGGTQTNEAKAEATESETEETEAEEQESEEMEDEEAESSGSRLGTLLKGAGVAPERSQRNDGDTSAQGDAGTF